jgi:hypothetical protein
MQASFHADLAPALAAVRDAEARTPAAITAMREQIATRLAAVTISAIESETPRITDKLAASTKARVIPTPDGATLEFYQDATSAPNEDGSGGGYQYAYAVWKGRPAIIAPSSGPWSTGKKALRTPWGPRKSVAASRPNPYPERAMIAAAGPMTLALHEGAQFGAGMIARTIGGAA